MTFTSPLLPPLQASSSSSSSSSASPSSSSSPSSPSYTRYAILSPAEEVAPAFAPHSSVSIASKVTLQSAGVGLLVSSVQNALDKHNKGAMGIFTRTGGTIAFFAAMGFTFSFTQAVTANIRETNDPLNAAAGGCAAGLVAGARARSFPIGVASCLAIGTLLATFEAAGNSLTGTDRQSLPRPEREQRRLQFFKQKKSVDVTGEEGLAA